MMTSTLQHVDQAALRRLARKFVRGLSALGLLEHTVRLQAAALANEETTFARAFDATDWLGVFGDVVEHEVVRSIEDGQAQMLSLSAYDFAGRALFEHTFRIADDHLQQPASPGDGEP